MREDRARTPGFATLALSCLVAACQATQVHYAPVTGPPMDDPPSQAVLFLLGDGGEDTAARDDVLRHLSTNVASVAADGSGPPVVVVFLGDNIYEEGVRPDSVAEDTEKLRGQVEALGDFPNVQGVFVPGNHDWADGKSDEEGLAAILRQRDAIEHLSRGRSIRMLPADGCPGPVSQPLGDSAMLMFFDSEWLLREPEDHCGPPEEFYRRISEELAANRRRHVIVMSHHPLVTGGPHGGNVGLLERAPLVYYLAAKAGVNVQDRASGAYSAMADRLERAFTESGAPPLVQAAGHDHSLQVIGLPRTGGSGFQLVSGSAAHTSTVRRVEGTRYAINGHGYLRLDFKGPAVRLQVYARTVGGEAICPVFACMLSSDGGGAQCPEAPRAESAR